MTVFLNSLASHAQQMIWVHSRFRFWNGFQQVLKNGVRGIDILAQMNIRNAAAIWRDSICQATIPLLCSCAFKESMDEKSRLISFVVSPITMHYFAQSVVYHVKEAYDSQKELIVRVYHVAETVLNAAYFGATAWVVHRALATLNAKVNFLFSRCRIFNMFNRILMQAGRLYGVASMTLPIVQLLEVYQVQRLQEALCEGTVPTGVDFSLIDECFKTKFTALDSFNKEQIQTHLRNYELVKMILTANSIVELAAEQAMFFSAGFNPASHLAFLVTTTIKLGVGYYWNRQVRLFTDEQTATDAFKVASQLTALASVISLPFLTLPAYTAYAVTVLTVSTAIDLALHAQFKN